MKKERFVHRFGLLVLLLLLFIYAAWYGGNLLCGKTGTEALPGSETLKKLYACFLYVSDDSAAVLPPLSGTGEHTPSHEGEKSHSDAESGSEALETAVSGNLLFWNNAAHAVFSDAFFDTAAYGDAVAALAEAAAAYTSGAQMAAVVSPISSFAAEIALEEDPNAVPAALIQLLGSTRQKDALVQLSAAVGDCAVFPDLYRVFAENREEYLFFRTDHHWTANGAYLAAAELLSALQREVLPADTLASVVTDEAFLGSFYRSTFSRPLETCADTVTVLMPKGDVSVTCYNVGGGILYSGGAVFAGESGVESFAGDAPLSVFKGEGEGTLLLIGDSFKNQLAPILAAHFGTVVSVDYRTYRSDGGLPAFSELLRRLNPDAVVLVQNIVNAGDAGMSEQIRQLAE